MVQKQKIKNSRWNNIAAIGIRVPSERVQYRITEDGKLDYFVVDENNSPLDNVIRDILTDTGEIAFIDITEAYRGAVNRLENAIQQVENGHIWNDETSCPPEVIKFDFLYPNGKHGDIDMFIASEYGEVRQIASLVYEVIMSTTFREQIALMGESYWGAGLRSQREDTVKLRRDEIMDFLYNYNFCFSVRALVRSALNSGMELNNPLRRMGEGINTSYRSELRDKRRKIYAELVSAGIATSKWKSEQQAYAIVKGIYPDAIYQYKADWLGFQSLDVFIPSKKIGIEYQGAQHYRPVSLFGGDEGLKKRLALDEEKQQKCRAHGVTLIEWRFNEPLTEEFISLKIAHVNL